MSHSYFLEDGFRFELLAFGTYSIFEFFEILQIIMLRSLMKPSDQRQAADQEKQIQCANISFLERPVLLVSINI
jgi:hypothetical protein